MDAGDWRDHVQAARAMYKDSIKQEIERLLSHPTTDEGRMGVAARLEEKIYNVSTSEDDYKRKMIEKLDTLQSTVSMRPVQNSVPSDSASNAVRSVPGGSPSRDTQPQGPQLQSRPSRDIHKVAFAAGVQNTMPPPVPGFTSTCDSSGIRPHHNMMQRFQQGNPNGNMAPDVQLPRASMLQRRNLQAMARLQQQSQMMRQRMLPAQQHNQMMGQFQPSAAMNIPQNQLSGQQNGAGNIKLQRQSSQGQQSNISNMLQEQFVVQENTSVTVLHQQPGSQGMLSSLYRPPSQQAIPGVQPHWRQPLRVPQNGILQHNPSSASHMPPLSSSMLQYQHMQQQQLRRPHLPRVNDINALGIWQELGAMASASLDQQTKAEFSTPISTPGLVKADSTQSVIQSSSQTEPCYTLSSQIEAEIPPQSGNGELIIPCTMPGDSWRTFSEMNSFGNVLNTGHQQNFGALEQVPYQAHETLGPPTPHSLGDFVSGDAGCSSPLAAVPCNSFTVEQPTENWIEEMKLSPPAKPSAYGKGLETEEEDENWVTSCLKNGDIYCVNEDSEAMPMTNNNIHTEINTMTADIPPSTTNSDQHNNKKPRYQANADCGIVDDTSEMNQHPDVANGYADRNGGGRIGSIHDARENCSNANGESATVLTRTS